MPLFPLSLAASRLYSQFQHLDDEEEGYPWAVICAAVAAPVDRLYSLLASTRTPWTLAYDLDNAPDWILPSIALRRGVDLTGITDPAVQRATIRLAPARRRGTNEAIAAIPLPWLSGTKNVRVIDRVNEDPYQLSVVTLPSETDDADAILAALRDPARGIPAGRRLYFVQSAEPTFEEGLRGVDDASAGVDSATIADVT